MHISHCLKTAYYMTDGLSAKKRQELVQKRDLGVVNVLNQQQPQEE